MFDSSPIRYRVRDMERQELLATVERYRIAATACQTQSSDRPVPVVVRFALVRSWARSALDALAPLAFGFSHR